MIAPAVPPSNSYNPSSKMDAELRLRHRRFRSRLSTAPRLFSPYPVVQQPDFFQPAPRRVPKKRTLSRPDPLPPADWIPCGFPLWAFSTDFLTPACSPKLAR